MAKVKWQKRAERELYKLLVNDIIKRFKLIYYYAESSDTVHIADIWDTRREPSKLSKRIK